MRPFPLFGISQDTASVIKSPGRNYEINAAGRSWNSMRQQQQRRAKIPRVQIIPLYAFMPCFYARPQCKLRRVPRCRCSVDYTSAASSGAAPYARVLNGRRVRGNKLTRCLSAIARESVPFFVRLSLRPAGIKIIVALIITAGRMR